MDGEQKNSLLIVDDEDATLKVLTDILGSEYVLYTATDGASAIEKAQKYLPDLILLDILMPGMDGYQTFSEIKKCVELRNIPVIFITALNSDEDQVKGLTLGAADYITKPFNYMIIELRVRNQVQIANKLRTMARLGMEDHLTHLPNRRSFDGRIRMEWSRAIREQTSISIMMIDVDKFKNFNDTYGHHLGDLVLQTIAKIFTHSFKRPGDFAARWGGEEFVVLLPNTPLKGALHIAEKIRANMENEIIPCGDGSTTKVTISIGVNSHTPVHGDSFETFFDGADKSLYAAKEAGRNKVMHSC